MQMRVQSLGWEDPLAKEMATQSSILAWEIPWTEEPGGLQSMGSQRVRHDLETKTRTKCGEHTLKNQKAAPSHDPAIPHLGVLPKASKTEQHYSQRPKGGSNPVSINR